MKNERLTVNGRVFKDCGVIAWDKVNYSTRGLNECYGKPSKIKQAIWEEWSNWFKELDSEEFGVASFNTNIFTISGVVEVNDKMYYVHIYPTHNDLYEIV